LADNAFVVKAIAVSSIPLLTKAFREA